MYSLIGSDWVGELEHHVTAGYGVQFETQNYI